MSDIIANYTAAAMKLDRKARSALAAAPQNRIHFNKTTLTQKYKTAKTTPLKLLALITCVAEDSNL